MKSTLLQSALFCFAICLCYSHLTSTLNAQPPNRGGQGGPGQGGGSGQGRGPGQGGPSVQSPLMRIFDTDGDNELSPKEIAGAVEALLKLDANRDGKLSAEELRPVGPGQGGPGAGRPGQGGPGQGGPGQGGPGQGGPGQGGPGQGGPGQSGPGRPGQGGPGQSGQQGGRGGDRERAFATDLLELDENKDGLLSRKELPEHMHSAFSVADADKNGTLNEAERLVFSREFQQDRLRPDGENTPIKNAPVQPSNRPK